MPELHKVSEILDPSDDDLEYGLQLLIEAEKIESNDALFKNLTSYASKKAKEYRSINDLRSVADDMALNPGKSRSEE